MSSASEDAVLDVQIGVVAAAENANLVDNAVDGNGDDNSDSQLQEEAQPKKEAEEATEEEHQAEYQENSLLTQVENLLVDEHGKPGWKDSGPWSVEQISEDDFYRAYKLKTPLILKINDEQRSTEEEKKYKNVVLAWPTTEVICAHCFEPGVPQGGAAMHPNHHCKVRAIGTTFYQHYGPKKRRDCPGTYKSVIKRVEKKIKKAEAIREKRLREAALSEREGSLLLQAVAEKLELNLDEQQDLYTARIVLANELRKEQQKKNLGPQEVASAFPSEMLNVDLLTATRE